MQNMDQTQSTFLTGPLLCPVVSCGESLSQLPIFTQNHWSIHTLTSSSALGPGSVGPITRSRQICFPNPQRPPSQEKGNLTGVRSRGLGHRFQGSKLCKQVGRGRTPEPQATEAAPLVPGEVQGTCPYRHRLCSDLSMPSPPLLLVQALSLVQPPVPSPPPSLGTLLRVLPRNLPSEIHADFQITTGVHQRGKLLTLDKSLDFSKPWFPQIKWQYRALLLQK